MKYNPISSTGVELRIFEKDFYSANIQRKGNEYFYNGRKIAERKSLPLTRDPVFKTQFYNEELSRALDQVHPETFWEFKKSDGNVINNLVNLPTLRTDLSSFVYEVEPDEPPVVVSVVLYEGPTAHDLLLRDGSNEMEPGYYPEEDLDIVTKQYVDDHLALWAAERDSLSTFTLKKSSGDPLDFGYRFTDNDWLPVLYIQKYYLGRSVNHDVLVDPFSIPPSWVNPKIAIMFDNTTLYISNITDIVAGTDTLWTLTSSKNIYMEDTPKLYWKNGYKLTFNPTDHAELISFNRTTTEEITAEVKIKIWDEHNNTKYSERKTIGIDYWMWAAEPNHDVQYVPEELQKNKNLWISGVAYYPPSEKDFTINLQIDLHNTIFTYYRPKVVARLFGIYSQHEKPVLLHEFSLDRHLPLFTPETYTSNIDITYTVGLTHLKLVSYNLMDAPISEQLIEFNADTDTSDESNRVSTPPGSIQYPQDRYGDLWNSKAPLLPHDMFLRNGVYTYSGKDVKESAVCFKVQPVDCYSHVNLDVTHNGHMYIKVQGMTGWLDCGIHKHPITNPIVTGSGCWVNEGFYSFGKVLYKEPVFIRIIQASRVELKSAVLG